MRFNAPPKTEDFHVRTRAFIEQIVLSIDAAAKDFSEGENVRSGDERR
ncbi:MAG: hypothetical protein WAK63_00605 [Xanthobacteraceae bacterium]